jgi:hypothetical protein
VRFVFVAKVSFFSESLHNAKRLTLEMTQGETAAPQAKV